MGRNRSLETIAKDKARMRKLRQNPGFKVRERKKQLEYYYKLRAEIYEAYGGAQCACCGETEFDFLSLDHINGGGAAHKRELGSTHRILQVLRKQGFPPGYQILCMNCNISKHKHGVCIHKIRGIG